MGRRVISAETDTRFIDDRDYVGNKRLELLVMLDIYLAI